MSETKGLYSLLMLALIFNIMMMGIFDFVNTQGLAVTNCDQDVSLIFNVSDIDESENMPQAIEHCEPEGLPWWFYTLWLIIDGVLLYAFIPFVK